MRRAKKPLVAYTFINRKLNFRELLPRGGFSYPGQPAKVKKKKIILSENKTR